MKFTYMKIRHILGHLHSVRYVFITHIYKTHVIKLLKLIEFRSIQSQVPDIQCNT
jgi:ribonuclease BN (tRNA processing enzyme)